MSLKSVEEIKLGSRGLHGSIDETLRTDATHFSEDELQVLKFHGSYQQDDRDERAARKQRGQDKAWMFMIRSKLPGGDLTAEQYLTHDRISQDLGNKTLRITTRQGFQIHGVLKGGLKDCIRRLNESGVTTWGACGDVVRNTTAPAAPIDDAAHRDAQQLAKEISETFLPRTTAYADVWLNGEKFDSGDVEAEEPIYGKQYLPRKFKIAIAIPPRNDVDVYTNDLGFIAHLEEGQVKGYTVVVGGGLAMTNGNQETFPALAQPLGYVTRDRVIQTALAIVTCQRDFGNRVDRKRARLKYLIKDRGIEWFRKEVQSRLSFPLEPARETKWDTVDDPLGWHDQGQGKLFCGIWIQDGRIQDSEQVRYRSAFVEIAHRFGFPVRLTPNCNSIFYNIDSAQRVEVDKILAEHGVPSPRGLTHMRKLAQACVALPTCGLALAESERVFPGILAKIDETLANLGLSDEPILIRMTGCPNGCARPYNADIAFVGRAPGKYALYVGGSVSGDRLASLQQKVMTLEEIPARVRGLLEDYVHERFTGETFSDYWGRTHIKGTGSSPQAIPN